MDKKVAEKCHVTGNVCGQLGIYCEVCPENPDNRGFTETPGQGPWQQCPVCYGRGKYEDYVLGSSVMHTCNVCNGKKIISIKTGLPPL